jgi:adenylate kinase
VALEVPEEELINRLVNRGQGRADDTPEKIKIRLDVYQEETMPVFHYYNNKGRAQLLSGLGSLEDVFSRIVSSLGKK